MVYSAAFQIVEAKSAVFFCQGSSVVFDTICTFTYAAGCPSLDLTFPVILPLGGADASCANVFADKINSSVKLRSL
jgi:hypothetical protein